MFRYPTAHSRPCNLTSEILALSVVENIILSGRYATSLGTGSYLGWACVGILSLGGRGLEFEWGNIVSEIGEARFLSFPPLL